MPEPLIDLLDKVCEPVSVATVESIAMVIDVPPSKLLPLRPVPIVNGLVVEAFKVPEPPNATDMPLYVTPALVKAVLGILVKVLVAPLIVTPANVDNVPPKDKLLEPIVTEL